MNIPNIILHAKKCTSNTECQLNSLLLDYFIQSELGKSDDPCFCSNADKER